MLLSVTLATIFSNVIRHVRIEASISLKIELVCRIANKTKLHADEIYIQFSFVSNNGETCF
jgi:hypothetical protein